MACVVYQVDKRTGIKYAYSSESYWDKDKKQPRSKRTFLGRVDLETGEIIPKKTRGSLKAEETPHSAATDAEQQIDSLNKQLLEKDLIISDLRNELRNLSLKYDKAQKALEKINSLSAAFLEE